MEEVSTLSNIVRLKQKEINSEKEKKDIIKKLKQSEKEIENGEGTEAEVVFKQLRQKYGY